MGAQVAVRPFVRREEADRRGRVLAVLASRAALFGGLAWAGGVAAAALYFAAHLLFRQMLHLGEWRVADEAGSRRPYTRKPLTDARARSHNRSYHHEFEQTIIRNEDDAVPMAGKTWAYEGAAACRRGAAAAPASARLSEVCRVSDSHTVSNFISCDRPWLNLLALNNGYHKCARLLRPARRMKRPPPALGVAQNALTLSAAATPAARTTTVSPSRGGSCTTTTLRCTASCSPGRASCPTPR